MLKKFARRLAHPVLGRTVQLFRTCISGKEAHPTHSNLEASRAANPLARQAAWTSAGQSTIEKQAEKAEHMDRDAPGKRVRRSIPGTYTYESLSDNEVPSPARGSNQRPAVVDHIPRVSFNLRATGSYKRNKQVASGAARQKSQKLRSLANLRRDQVSKGSPEPSTRERETAFNTRVASRSKRSGRYGLFDDDSSISSCSQEECEQQLDEMATDMPKDREGGTMETEEGAPHMKREVKAGSNPFETETHEPTGRRVASSGGYHSRTRPRLAPLPKPMQVVTGVDQHAEFLRLFWQAEENERLAKESAPLDDAFQEHIRSQQREEEASQERLNQERLEKQRLHQSQEHGACRDNSIWEILENERTKELQDRLRQERLEKQRLQEFRELIERQEREQQARQEYLRRERLEKQRLDDLRRLHAEEEIRRRREAEERADKGCASARHSAHNMQHQAPSIQARLSAYHRKWEALKSGDSRDLRFCDMPWPVLDEPHDLSSLTLANIEAFITLKQGCTPQNHEGWKQVFKEYIMMWHPDRFVKYRQDIYQPHWPMIQQGVHAVAQVLIRMKDDKLRFTL